MTAQGIQVLRDRVAAPVPALDRVPVQAVPPCPVRLRVVAGLHQLDHVPEPHRSFGGVPLQQGLLGVEPAHRVGHAALEPDRHLPAVACQPAGDEFARLVGALENRIHDMPHRDEGLVPGFTPGPRELGSGLHRGQAQVSSRTRSRNRRTRASVPSWNAFSPGRLQAARRNSSDCRSRAYPGAPSAVRRDGASSLVTALFTAGRTVPRLFLLISAPLTEGEGLTSG